MFVGAGNDRFFRRLCTSVGLADLASDPRFATNDSRVEHRDEFERLLGDELARLPPDAVVELLADAGVPVAPVNTVDRLLAEPQVQHRGLVATAEHAALGAIPVPTAPVTFSGFTPPTPTAAPTYGEHTR